METKKCSKCGQEKSLSEFYLDKRTGKYRSWCKDCFRNRTGKVKDIPKLEDKVIKECDENNLGKVPARLLVSELRRRGYRGKLELVTIQEVVI